MHEVNEHPMSTAEVWNYLENLANTFDLSTTEGRQEASYDNPLAFALIYFSHHLENDEGALSFATAHHEWVSQAKTWMHRKPSRDVYVAPRSLGKSTFFFLILPMWAAAYGYTTFIAAYADSSDQATNHLQTFRSELDLNDLLREDFPDLCTPAKRNGRPIADREDKYKANSGLIFVAKGMDSSNLGTKDGANRPDLIILDDIEPDGSNYGPTQKDKRLATLLESILYLNISARVVLSGTVTMSGSIVDDLTSSITDGESVEQWITTLKPPFSVHHHKPIITDPDTGVEQSIWPANAKFDLAFMRSIMHTPAFAKNYLNRPMSGNGALWVPDSFRYEPLGDVGGLLLSIDPAVTTKSTSDYTAIALIGWSKWDKKAVVVDCLRGKWTPEQLQAKVVALCNEHPVTRVLVETNQGGDLWKSILHDLDVPLSVVHQTDKKEVRAARVFTLYDKGLVHHAKVLPVLEAELMSFPNGVNDDQVDVVGSGIIFLTKAIAQKRRTVRTPKIRQASYI